MDMWSGTRSQELESGNPGSFSRGYVENWTWMILPQGKSFLELEIWPQMTGWLNFWFGKERWDMDRGLCFAVFCHIAALIIRIEHLSRRNCVLF